MHELLADRSFRVVLAAQTLSMAGDWTLLLVFGIWAKTLTGDDSIAALMVFAMAAPALLSPLGAVFVDRFPRRSLLVAISGISSAVLLLLWFVSGPKQVWLIAVVAMWSGFSSVVLNAAVTALLQDVLPTALLGRANGMLATTRQGLRLGAPLLGAGLFAVAGGATVATIDAGTFVLSALLLLLLRAPESARPLERVGFRAELVAGVRHLLGTPVLRRYLTVNVLLFAAFGLVDAAIFALVGLLHRPPTFISVLVTAQGAAALLSGIAVTGHAHRVRPVVLGIVGSAAAAAGLGLLAVGSVPTAFAGVVVLGAGQPLLGVASATLLQLRTPSGLIGRVSAAFDATSSLFYTALIAVGALLLLALPVSLVLTGSALGCLAATFVAIRAAQAHDGDADRGGDDAIGDAARLTAGPSRRRPV